jgi:hypothetical protein
MGSWFAWSEDESDASLAWITKPPKELDRQDWKVATGFPSASWFPRDVAFDLARDKGEKLGDAIPTAVYLLVLSEKLASLLTRESGARWETFPIKLRQNRKPIDARYVVANLLDIAPCVDLEKSAFERNQVIPAEVDFFDRLVLDEAKVPKDRKIFRMKEQPRTILVRDDLVSAIRAAGCTGVTFVPTEQVGPDFR